ncbi:MAG: hypothetical protein ACRDNM_00095 [Gaiellaceae bacterium]
MTDEQRAALRARIAEADRRFRPLGRLPSPIAWVDPVALAAAADVLQGAREVPVLDVVGELEPAPAAAPPLPSSTRSSSTTATAPATRGVCPCGFGLPEYPKHSAECPKAATMGACEQALICVLSARDPKSMTRDELAIVSGYSCASDSYAGALALLRQARLIEGPPDALRSTAAGRHEARGYTPDLPRGNLITYWAEKVGTYAGTLLEVATAAYPGELGRDDLAARAGYPPTSGSYASARAKLRKLHLLAGFRATGALMQNARAAS